MSEAGAEQTVVEPVVLFEEREAAGERRIGIATLNSPKTLNGLSLQMAELLDAKLIEWAADDGIALVVLQGAGEKAFCAGGDLHGLYKGMLEDNAPDGSSDSTDGERTIRTDSHAGRFFETEYRLDHRIHTYPKPFLCWGHGIVMGGGIGLMSGASHRVVSERSRIAFPEITVGLYPDVGGSWLLNKVPGRGGVFLALTGAPLNAGDAIHAGLADMYVPEAEREAVFDNLASIEWSRDADEARKQLSDLLQPYASSADEGPLQRLADRVADICSHDSLDAIVEAINAIDTDEGADDPWLQNAKKTLAAGSPGSARLGYELQHRAANLSLADTFRLEYIASLHCAAHGDFQEGIRALLIDKDRKPKWNPATLEEATPQWAETFMTAPWTDSEHPLSDLS